MTQNVGLYLQIKRAAEGGGPYGLCGDRRKGRPLRIV